jgi:DNA-binding CsgD family transcriptional regulator/sugar-specific transcriptional regulator TrmB
METVNVLEMERIDELALRCYAQALHRPPFTAADVAAELEIPYRFAEQAIAQLCELRLVRAVDGDPGGYLAVSPETARLELSLPLEETIVEGRRRLARLTGRLNSFAEVFEQRGSAQAETAERIESEAALRLRLLETVRRCRGEILVMQPCVANETAELRLARPLVLDAARNGVSIRILYPHTARGDADTRSHVADLIQSGGQVRTTKEVLDRFLIFDRRVAFVPAEDALSVRYEGAVAGFLAGMHERLWDAAFDFDSGASGYDAGTMQDLRSTILDLLASGAKDEVIARRVGMSERTFRRHLAAIMEELSATSRFQAGVLAARGGLLASDRREVPAQRRSEPGTLAALGIDRREQSAGGRSESRGRSGSAALAALRCDPGGVG